MNKGFTKIGIIIGLFIAVAFGVFLTQNVAAVAVDKITWCHVESNGNQQTLQLTAQALLGHQDAQGNILHAGDHAGACVEPTPTNEPTPTEEITPTPTVTPTETPAITPTPEQKQEASSDNSGGGVTTPSCGDSTPKTVANINVITGEPNDGKVTVQWSLPEGADKVHIRYSEDDGLWRYAVLNIPNTGSYEIGGLNNGVHYWFQVAGVSGCAVGNWSRSFDPLP